MSEERSTSDPASSLSRLVDAVALGLVAESGTNEKRREVFLDGSVIQLARRHRLEGFIERHKTELNVPEEILTVTRNTAWERAQQGLSQRAASISLSRLLTQSGIQHLIFKGSALTLQTSAEPDSRGGGDVDLLIRPHDVQRTNALLISNHYLPVYAIGPKTTPGWKFVSYRNREMPYRSPHIEVDLHWRIGSEPDLLPSTSELLGRARTVGPQGQELPTLSPTDALAACAVHFFLDYGVALRRLVDFVRLARISDRHQLATLPSRSQQLVADVAELCRELFGEEIVQREIAIPHLPENVRHLSELFWSGTGGYTHSRAAGTGWHRLTHNYRHLGLYTNSFTLILRLLARGLVWFPETNPSQPAIGLIRAFWLQFTRILGGRFDSQV